MSSLLLPLLALLTLCASFALVYRLARRMDNYGIVDIAWSYAFAPLVLFYALAGSGWGPRRALIATLVTLWSLRLGTHLYRRVMSHHPVEDTRYQALRQNWAANFSSKMAWFFQSQAASVVVLGVPFFLIVRNPAPTFHPLEIAATALWLLALLGEALADAQLSAFRHDPANRGKVCTVGLWRYSRHPNYFFEWLIWVAYFVFALASPWGCLAVIAPGAILYLLLRVTGIPMAEQQSLRSKGDAYRHYQATTSAFVPWFPKQAPHA
jgi:steroid 5-alpha reductase family enzyme